jgi:AcrR family transcriptional regulator
MNRNSSSEALVQPLRVRMRAATRAAILEAAEAVFAERGFHGARMEEIASRAGVAVGTLYNYFEDRKHLLGALLDEGGAELTGALEASLKGRRAFRDRLEDFLRAALRHLDRHWRIFAILVEEELAHGRGGSGGSKHRPMLREVYAVGERLCALGVRQGALRRDGAELFPSLLVGAVHSMFRHQLFTNRGEPIEGHVPALVRFFLEGAGAAP